MLRGSRVLFKTAKDTPSEAVHHSSGAQNATRSRVKVIGLPSVHCGRFCRDHSQELDGLWIGCECVTGVYVRCAE